MIRKWMISINRDWPASDGQPKGINGHDVMKAGDDVVMVGALQHLMNDMLMWMSDMTSSM